MALQDNGALARIQIVVGAATVTFTETEVPTFSYVGDDPVDNTTNVITKFRRRSPGAFITKEDVTATVQYDPAERSTIAGIMQQKGTITVTFPDNSQESDTGWIKDFSGTSMVINEMPVANVVFSFEGEQADGTDDYAYA